MQRPNVISRIRVRRVSSFLAFALVLFVIGSSLFGGFLGPRPKSTKAFDLDINATNRYMLDGWEMSNSNSLQRVAPSVNRNGQSIRVSNRVVQRMDNSAGGFNNNPLFASIDASNPLSYTYQSSDGTTHLSDLEIAGEALVTHTPLDYLSLNDNDRMLVSGFYSFGLKISGYYYSANNNPDLQITAAADDGCEIEAYYGGSWHVVSSDYANHAIRFPTDPLTSINYTGGTFLPIRIKYYNVASDGGHAALSIFVKNESGDWYIPTWGSGSTAGRFYALPEASNDVEGLVVDYYQDNNTDKKYYGNEVNTFSSWWRVDFDNTTAFSMNNYRYSYRDVYYMNTFSTDDEWDDDGVCALQYNHAYASLPNAATLAECDGRGGPFVLEDGLPPARYPATQELFTLDGFRHVFEWLGGRSRVKLDVSNNIVLDSGHIDVTGNGWIAGPMVDRSHMSYPDINPKGWGGAVMGTSHLNGGGWPNYNNSHNNGIAGGGSYGGYGDAAEPFDGDWPWWSLGRPDVYGAPDNVEYHGSGGGSMRTDYIRHGGSGGGYISLKAANIEMTSDSHIKANGLAGYREGGAGSGGGIHITGDINLTSLYSSFIPDITANGGPNGFGSSSSASGYGGGGRIYIEGNVVSSSGIFAYAGCQMSGECWHRSGNLNDKDPALYWATDGTVLIKKSPVTIYKYLMPVSRYNLADTTFNPYSLQSGQVTNAAGELVDIGDVIQVNLELRNLGYTPCPGAPLAEKLSVLRSIYDEYLHTNDGGDSKVCRYVENSAIFYHSDDPSKTEGMSVSNEGDSLRINLSCAAVEPVRVNYQCQVK